MFIILGDISFDSLPEGSFSKRRLTAAEAQACLDAVPENSPVIGCFDFGPVPSARRERTFRDILSALASRHDVHLPLDIFFTSASSDDPAVQESELLRLPVPPQMARLSPERPILVVSYAFCMSSDFGEAGDGLDGILSRMRVSPGAIEFHILEMLPST